MRVLIDTSVVIAALVRGHVHGAIAVPFLNAAHGRRFEFVFSGHSLAEVFAVLSSYPIRPPIAPAVAQNLIEANVLKYAHIVTLSVADYREVIENQARQNLPGGLVYDAVIAKAAELGGADYLATFNLAHFRRVWPSRAGQVLTPDLIPIP